MVSAMRVILACSALLVTVIDPSGPERLVFPTYLALTGYVIYSGIIYILAIRHSRILTGKFLHWLDVAWYLALVAVSSGTNSIFFFFFFFAILVASFGWGFSEGLRVTIVSAVLVHECRLRHWALPPRTSTRPAFASAHPTFSFGLHDRLLGSYPK